MTCSVFGFSGNGSGAPADVGFAGRDVVDRIKTTRPELCWVIGEFINIYNHRRYHEDLGKVAPADGYDG